MGFGGKVLTKEERSKSTVLRDAQAHDIVKFGMIPELVGRLPVIVSLDPLDKAALISILKKPKNALLKQYQKLLQMDGVELDFTEEALDTVADLAVRRNTGARGLRSIMEDVMLNVMYEAPGIPGLQKVVITPAVVEKKETPQYICKTDVA